MKFPIVFILIFLTFFLFSCEYVQKRIDISSIKDLKQELFTEFQPGDPEELTLLLDSLNLEKDTRPLFIEKINIRKRKKWILNDEFADTLVEEIITFPSLLSKYIPGDSARFYTYRISDYKKSKTILWVPGFGVSDKAFFFIKKIFIEELKQGYNVVVYIPPYHLERKLKDKNDGDGFFSSNMQKNLIINFEELREIRTINQFLKNQGVEEISAWGGSMGASTLLLSTKFTRYNHITLMIPLIDWREAVFSNQIFNPFVDSLASSGFDSLLIAKALGKISPVTYNIPINPDKTFVQYAKYDQLNSELIIQKFTHRNNIINVKSYKTSHATILLSRKLYKDYAAFLDSVN